MKNIKCLNNLHNTNIVIKNKVHINEEYNRITKNELENEQMKACLSWEELLANNPKLGREKIFTSELYMPIFNYLMDKTEWEHLNNETCGRYKWDDNIGNKFNIFDDPEGITEIMQIHMNDYNYKFCPIYLFLKKCCGGGIGGDSAKYVISKFINTLYHCVFHIVLNMYYVLGNKTIMESNLYEDMSIPLITGNHVQMYEKLWNKF